MQGETEVYQQAKETYTRTAQHSLEIYLYMAQALSAIGKFPQLFSDLQFRMVEMNDWMKKPTDGMNWFELTLHNIDGTKLGSQCMTACDKAYNQIVAVEPQRDLPTYLQMADIYDRRGIPGLMQHYDLDHARAEYFSRMIQARMAKVEGQAIRMG